MACREALEVDDVEPDCFSGRCILGFDRLAGEDLRLLEIWWLLAHLADHGLAQDVAKEYQLSREDLCNLALIESECREMAREKEQGKPDGEGS